jgi:hypothetical protein
MADSKASSEAALRTAAGAFARQALLRGVAALALLAAGTASLQAQNLDLQGRPILDPRAIDADPRAIVQNPFQSPAPRPLPGPSVDLRGTESDRPQSASGGPVSRRAASRASRPVQGRIAGQAQRRVRAEPRSVSVLPAQPAEPLGLRPTTSTRIVAPAADGLQSFPSRRPPRPETDPWAPLGLRLGSFVVNPAITQSVGYDTNPGRLPNAAKGSLVSRTEGELNVRSEWLTHSFTSSLRAGYSYYPDRRDASRPDAQGTSLLRLNASRDTDIDLETRLSLDTQRPGSPNLNAAARERPNVYGYGGSAGVTQRFNRLSLNLRGSADRTTYDDASDTLGARIIQSDRDATQVGLRGRVGYELSPGFQPFLEASVDNRVFDRRADQNGFQRGSVGVGGRIGSSFELTRLLTGEVSIGYQQRSYDDARLKELRGLVGDASLIWSATPLTTVTLRAGSELADTTVPGVSGALNRRIGLEVAHAFRRNWTVAGFAGLQRQDFDGLGVTEDTYQLGVRTEYKLTRTTSVRASFTHERLKSTTPGSDYTANIVLVGLRLQL